MLAPVIVDLGPDAGAREIQIVIAACNAAVADGECRAGGSEDAPARAFAVVRAADESALVVRIEVRLDWADEGSWLVREIVFSRRDPLRERWRSVGLAIGTLVGEGEQRARQVAEEPEAAPAAPEPEPPAPPPSVSGASPVPAPGPAQQAAPVRESPEPPEPPRERASEPLQVGEADAPASERSDAAPDDAERRPVFIGIGVLGGTGFGSGPWRVGAELNAGWDAPSGLWIATSVAYAWRTSEATFTAEWFSIDAGLGYRAPIAEHVSLGALVFGGAQRTRFEVLAAGVSRSEAAWSPRVGASADLRWQALPAFGLWASARASSSLRESRLFVAPDREPVRSFPVDVVASAGIAWWLH